MSPSDEEIIKAVGTGAKTFVIAFKLGMSESGARRRLLKLYDNGKIDYEKIQRPDRRGKGTWLWKPIAAVEG